MQYRQAQRKLELVGCVIALSYCAAVKRAARQY